jgi:murein DD-endopeptidase MepM/ murein hydrolase activator NlpD
MVRNRFIACVLLCTVLVGSGATASTAVTRVRHALLERHETVQDRQELRHQRAELEASLRHRIARLRRTSDTKFLTGLHTLDDRRTGIVAATRRMLVVARSQLRLLGRRTRMRLRALHMRYANLQRWLDEQGLLRVCPVPGFTEIADNFGVIVRIPHVPVHIHEGNDVMAPAGGSILAPFDGLASAGHDKLGGYTVRVFGAQGYVYNAHLSRFGQLGWVHAGDVIGYVGSTGDATAPHDHFEWHPNDGPAVDPHALLLAACASVAAAP